MVEQDFFEQRTYQEHPLWRGGGPPLSCLDIELTERCNNACIHCYINLPENQTNAKARELSAVEWYEILDQAADLGTLSVRITGGEPLLRPDFQEIYLHARQLGMKVTLSTNGRLITPELATLFSRIPPLEKLEITVYGMTPETYRTITGDPEGYFEFRGGVDLLLDHQIPFVVKGVWLPAFEPEKQAFETWAAEIPWMDGAPAYSKYFDLRGRRDSQPKNQHIQKLRINPAESLQIFNQDEPRFRQEIVQFCSHFMGPAGQKMFTCGAGKSGCVDAYGMFQPCILLRSSDLCYDLRTGSLRDALERFFSKMRALEAENPLYLERCARCFLYGLCEQCPAKSWSEHGTLDTPVDYLCQVAHARARDLGLIAEDERAWEVEDWQERIKKMVAQS